MSMKRAEHGRVDYSQTCLGSVSLLSIKVVRSIIHSSICPPAVSLTPTLPGGRPTDKYNCSQE